MNEDKKKTTKKKIKQNWGKKESDEPGKNIIWESGFYFLVHPKLLKESLTLECFWGGLGFLGVFPSNMLCLEQHNNII